MSCCAAATQERLSPNVRCVWRIGPIPIPTSYKRIGILLGIDSTTTWMHWKQCLLYGLSDLLSGRPSIPSDEQLDHVTEFAVEEF
jgi:hypothetical protein